MMKTRSLAVLAALLPMCIANAAREIPLEVPRYDGRPGDPAKPVQVYILAGQSNMVGFGHIANSRPFYPSVFLSADPAIIRGAMPIGGSALAAHGVHQSDAADSKPGAVVKLFPGAYDPAADYSKLSPTETATVALGTVADELPGLDGPHTAVATAFIDVPETGSYTLNPGFGDSTHAIGPDQEWVERQDVVLKEARLKPDSPARPLSATANGNMFGPELGFGFVMGTFHDEPVLLIKTAQGNRALGFEFKPPSSGRTDPDNEWEGMEYRLMVEGVRNTLAKIAEIVPGYQGQGYEIAGFAWWQGHKDAGATKEEYEKNLANLIKDLRKEFDAPDMRAVVATVGFAGYRMNENYQRIWAAQMAVGDAEQHPDFAGNVASVDTRDFWRDAEEAPQPQDFHYNRSAETFLLTGEAMGRAMVNLLGGKAEMISKSDREQRIAARLADEAAKPEPTPAERAASLAATTPMVIDGALVSFTTNPRMWPGISTALASGQPDRFSGLLDDTLDEAANHFRTVGIPDYDWKPFGDLRSAEWHYHPFDLADPSKGVEDIASLAPAGMENWMTPAFDPAKAGWRKGTATFGGSRNHADAAPRPDWYGGPSRPEATTVIEHDGVLLTGTFDLPPLKDGHRYRIRVHGSVRANHGDGYAIFVNGKPLAGIKEGIVRWRREGHRPRGSHVWADFRDEFKGGKVTISVAAFPMNNRPEASFIPDRDPLGVWIEKMKIPPLVGPVE